MDQDAQEIIQSFARGWRPTPSAQAMRQFFDARPVDHWLLQSPCYSYNRHTLRAARWGCRKCNAMCPWNMLREHRLFEVGSVSSDSESDEPYQ